MTYELEILAELRAINGMLVKILEAIQERQSVPGPGYSINVNWEDYDFYCDHEWVPNEDGLTTAISLYHCASRRVWCSIQDDTSNKKWVLMEMVGG